MKLLLLHSDYIEYEVKDKAISNPEEISLTKDRLEEALTVFIAVEKNDEKHPKQVVINSSTEIEKTANQLKVKNIMLYPIDIGLFSRHAVVFEPDFITNGIE